MIGLPEEIKSKQIGLEETVDHATEKKRKSRASGLKLIN